MCVSKGRLPGRLLFSLHSIRHYRKSCNTTSMRGIHTRCRGKRGFCVRNVKGKQSIHVLTLTKTLFAVRGKWESFISDVQ